MKMERLIGILSILLQQEKVTALEMQAILAGLKSLDSVSGSRGCIWTICGRNCGRRFSDTEKSRLNSAQIPNRVVLFSPPIR